MAIRVLVADDHRMICEALSTLLEKEPDMDLVAVAYDLATALRLAAETIPDVIVISMGILEANDFEACRHIIGEVPQCRIIALSIHRDKRYVVKAFKAGARGYILKESAFAELAVSIRSVAGNNGYLDPRINEAAIQKLSGDPPGNKQLILSSREQEVLRLMAEGKNNREISASLEISSKTIESHRRNISRKLGTSSIADLTRYAIREGISPL